MKRKEDRRTGAPRVHGQPAQGRPADDASPGPGGEAVLDELLVYKAELEIQNEELRRTRLIADEALQYYKGLFEALPIVALILDGYGLILEGNREACELFGFRSAAKLRQHAIYRLMQQHSATRLAEALREGLAPGAMRQLPELDVRAAAGETLRMEAHLACVPGSPIADRRFMLLMVDRTPERMLAQQAQLFETIINHADSLIYAFDDEQRCMVANDALLKLLGRTRSEVIGHRRAAFMPAEDAAAHERNDGIVWVSGKAMAYEEELHRSGGSARYFLSSKFPLRNADGQVFAVAGITSDVTATKHAAQRLELAMRVFSQGNEGVIICNAAGAIVSVNRAFEQITGYTEAEVLGQNPRLLASGRHNKAFYTDMWSQIKSAGKWEGEIWNRRKSGEIYPEWLTISTVGVPGAIEQNFVGVFADITHRKLAEEEIERLAFYDMLTGLPNRYLLKDRTTQLQRLSDRAGRSFALAFIDLDHFKEVNDVYGHDAGDVVLKEAVERMREQTRESDTLARLGGDEFVWLVAEISAEQMVKRLENMLRRLGEPYALAGDRASHVSASIGLAVYPDDGRTYEELLKNADIAMYAAKTAGRSTFRFFNVRMAEVARARYQLESLLRGAIDQGELRLVYQPQFDLATRRVVGLEALLRWNSPVLGEVPPASFIAVAEQSALINVLDTWVLDQVCRQMADWRSEGLDGFSVAVNVSARQFWGEDFVSRVQQALATHGLPAHRLEIELTERLAMEDAQRSVNKMRALKALGVRLSIDDFGTGYSSLAYLRWMPVDVLKIDKSFVDEIGSDADDETICTAIIQLGKGLALKLLAEGVETEAQARFLCEAGCHLAQGFLVAKPLPAAELASRFGAQLGKAAHGA